MNKEEIQYLIDNAEYEPQPLIDYITNLQQRIKYLERSNNRREDTIIGLRLELAEQEDYKSRCEKAVEYLKECYSQPENIENFMTESEMNYLLNILQNGSDSQ